MTQENIQHKNSYSEIVILVMVVAIFLAIIGGVIVKLRGGTKPVTFYCTYEKKRLLEDVEILNYLKSAYSLEIAPIYKEYKEMVAADLAGIDGIWPSNNFILNMITDRYPQLDNKDNKSNIFNSPVVFFMWPEVVKNLSRNGLIIKRHDSYYLNLASFIKLIAEKRSWQSLDMDPQYGKINVAFANPRYSPSGLMVAGLLAVALNGGHPPDTESIVAHLGTMADLFRAPGHNERSSAILYEKFLTKGQGTYPIMAGLEHLYIEYSYIFRDKPETYRDFVHMVIPQPTMWSSHPFLALTSKGKTLAKALRDQWIQQIAWKRFGYRHGVAGIDYDWKTLYSLGIPRHFEIVIPMPSHQVMNKILAYVPK